MPNWKQLIVGDAFRLPSREINYYRDLFLFWPFLIASIGGISQIFNQEQRTVAFKCLVLALLFLFLAKEKLILLVGSLGFCAVQSLLAYLIKQDVRGLIGFVLLGIPALLLVRHFREYKPSYEWPKDMTIIDLVVGLSSLGLTIVAVHWLGHKP